ncbi:MAG: hypothetical protein CMP10_20740 [Zetaproteobacteria bacterium]|nr:hypothetical protein [Pseudobdellovibrionaceae bacterium]
MKFNNEEINVIVNTGFFESIVGPLQKLVELRTPKGDGDDETQCHFPKMCTNCGKTYSSAQDFMQKTVSLEGEDHDVCYIVGQKTKILRYRNCHPPCSSTLVFASDERRDTSSRGLQCRNTFEALQDILLTTFHSIRPHVIHNVTLYLFRVVLFENMTPFEAYFILKKDVEERHFMGFNQESSVVVEEIEAPKAS